MLLEILDHLNVKLRIDAISAVIPQFTSSLEDRVRLGGIILHGQLYIIELIADGESAAINMYRSGTIMLYDERSENPVKIFKPINHFLYYE